MTELLAGTDEVGLNSMLEDVQQLHTDLPQADRLILAKMFGSMSSDSPTLSYFPLEVAIELQALIGSESQQRFTYELQELLQSTAPLFLEFCAVLDRMHNHVAPGQAIMSRYRDCLLQLIACTLRCCSGGPELSSFACEQQSPSSTSHACLSSGVCVGVSQVRHRPRYELDQVKDLSGCRHSFVSGSHGSKRTGGIFTWFCRHGVCYAFYIIPNAEGRNEAFSFLLKYFKVAPKVVVYDFACALQDYCLNRQPEHFKNTAFLVDRFHWFNHVSCARSYNLSLYGEYAYLNSQIAEQCNNSALSRIKCSCSQMKQVTFMSTVRFFLEMWNQRKIDILSTAMQHVLRLE